MTLFQILMLGASAYFAFKIYEHIQTLEDSDQRQNNNFNDTNAREQSSERSVSAFSTFSADELIEKADNAFEEENFEKALAFLMEANAKESNNSEVLFKIGYILQKQDDNDSALDYYKQALELDKDNEFIHNSVASIYRSNKEYSSARMHLNQSLALDDQNPITYYNYGNLLLDMGHTEEAGDMYAKAIELNPDFQEAKDELENIRNL
jgi:tetratricopeptide (TPR) repeat protein